MQIAIKGRNVPVTDEIRAHVERRLSRVARQVSDLARLEIELYHERNPRVVDSQVAEATLYLKGVTLRAREASPEIMHSLNVMCDELARQVKRHRDKRRHRREAHAAASERRTAGGPNLASQPSV
jgi:putative sigma-54 modulation protein